MLIFAFKKFFEKKLTILNFCFYFKLIFFYIFVLLFKDYLKIIKIIY